MTAKSKSEIKAFFETGDKPTEDQFIDLIDSYVDASGPVGTLEAAASAHSGTGFTNWSTGTPSIGDASTTLSNLGATVVTTAAASAVAVDACRPVFVTTAQASAVAGVVIASAYATTAQAEAGTATGVLMNPVLTKNAIAALESGGGSGAWTLISTATASNSASIDFTSGIDSTYDHYVFVLEGLTAQTDDTELRARLARSGAFDSGSSDYNQSTFTSTNNNALVFPAGSDNTSIHLTESAQRIGNASTEHVNGQIHLYMPSNASFYTMTTYDIGQITADGDSGRACGSGILSTAAAVDGLQVLFASGNVVAGVIRMYGVNKS